MFVSVYPDRNNNSKIFFVRKHYLQKSTIKNYNVVITGKNFYDQPIDSDIKRHEEIRKLTTGQEV